MKIDHLNKATGSNRIFLEISAIFVILVVSFFIFGRIDLLEKIVEYANAHEEYEIDEIFSTSIVFVVLLLVFSYRRMLDLQQKNDWLNIKYKQIEEAQAEIKELKGILPICSHCHKIRDDQGYWNQLEKYIHEHSEVKFSHSICQECAKKHYPDFDIYED